MARSKVALIVAGTIVLLVGITSIILIIFFSLKVAEVTTDKPKDSSAEVLYPEFSKLTEGWVGSSGPAFDKNGIFYFTESSRKIDGNYRGRVLKIIKSSGIVAKVDTDGRALQGCNDLTFDYKGTLWFTGPATAIAPANYTFKPESVGDPIGSIYAMVKFGEIIRIAKNYAYPNGIAVQHTADGRPSKLIVAETGTGNLWSHNIISPGKVASRQLWGKVPEQAVFSGPDGMEFDDEGYLLVAHWGSSHIEVFSPRGGAPVARIKCPFSKPSNLEFRPNSSEVYVTDQTYNALWRFKWRTKGRKKWAFL